MALGQTHLDVAWTRTRAGDVFSRARVRGVETDTATGTGVAGRFDAAFYAGRIIGAVVFHAEA